MAAARPVLYREVLTPVLHRRFTKSALLLFFLCYIEAVFIGEKTSFLWSWFPIGPVAIKTLLLFISALAVFILRVGSLHLGARSSPSAAASLLNNLVRFDTVQTFAWYIFSAWWFGEIYIWTASAASDLGWITQPNAWERDRLNERPIYLRSVFLLLALSQSFTHLVTDSDHLRLALSPPGAIAIKTRPESIPAWITQRLNALKSILFFSGRGYAELFASNVLVRTLVISISSPIIYSLFLRRTAWDWTFSFASLLWSIPPQRQSFFPPAYPSLVWRSITAGCQLVLLWEAANVYFNLYTSKPPIKKEQPLSAESTDPTGTLLNGLKSKKEIPRTFANWELSLITAHFPERRKAIFTDIDRPSGAAWTQVLTSCIENITAINTRINHFLSPPPPPSQAAPAPAAEKLPHISTPLRNENIFTKSPAPANRLEKIENEIGSLAKAYGQSPTPGTLHLPSLSPQSKAKLNSSTQRLLSSSPSAQKLLTAGPSAEANPTSTYRKLARDYVTRFLLTSFGKPFRQTFSRRVTSIIFGQPYSSLPSSLYSIRSLSSLAVHSLNEDTYGRVSHDVALLIRTFTETIQTIEAFVKNLPPHWTDVEFQEAEDRDVDSVEEVLLALKAGLGDMCEAFGKYAKELGLREEEMRVATKAAVIPGREQGERENEMRQTDQGRGVWAVAG